MTELTMFSSPLGRCAIAWTERGIVALQLPEKSEAQTRKKLQLRATDAVLGSPPEAVQRVIDDVVALMSGEARDLSKVTLDVHGLPAATQLLYERVREIPVGATRSIVDIGGRAAIERNPLAILVPTHRLLAANGRMSDSTNGGVATRMRLLTTEAAIGFEDARAFGFDPDDAVQRLREDPRFRKLIDRVGPLRMKIRPAPSIFAALAESIVYQQLSGHAAGTIWARVRALFPHGHLGPAPEQLEKVKDDVLRGAGLSQNKLLALRDLARCALDGTIPTLAEVRLLDDETLIERLTVVRGIGRWTVEMLLMFRLGRPDVLPVDDLGVRKGYAVMMGKSAQPTIAELTARGERWRPFRTVASWYLWRATELPTRPNARKLSTSA